MGVLVCYKGCNNTEHGNDDKCRQNDSEKDPFTGITPFVKMFRIGSTFTCKNVKYLNHFLKIYKIKKYCGSLSVKDLQSYKQSMVEDDFIVRESNSCCLRVV